MKHQSRRLLIAWVALLVAVIVLSVLPGQALPAVGVDDSLMHWLVYVPLALLPTVAIASRLTASLAAILMAPLGLVLEVAQMVAPGRRFEWSDVAADALGVMAGMVLGWLVRPWWRSRADLRRPV